MKDVFRRIEDAIVAAGELLDNARRYRALEEEGERLYLASVRLGARARRAGREADTAAAAEIEAELGRALGAARRAIADVVAGSAYRSLVSALASGRRDALGAAVPSVFADVEAVAAPEAVLSPISGKRGEGLLEPEAGVEAVCRVRRDGIEPAPGPGVGGDDRVRPIRLYESADGLDAAVFLVVRGEDLPAPVFRASGIGEILVYAPRIAAPFTVGIRSESPDEWFETRSGGYRDYRARWRELLESNGFVVRDLRSGRG